MDTSIMLFTAELVHTHAIQMKYQNEYDFVTIYCLQACKYWQKYVWECS